MAKNPDLRLKTRQKTNGGLWEKAAAFKVFLETSTKTISPPRRQGHQEQRKKKIPQFLTIFASLGELCVLAVKIVFS